MLALSPQTEEISDGETHENVGTFNLAHTHIQQLVSHLLKFSVPTDFKEALFVVSYDPTVSPVFTVICFYLSSERWGSDKRY